MLHTYSAKQIRHAEAAALAVTGDGVLMRRAAQAVADAAARALPTPIPGRSVVLLVGPGNNGGDALFAGAALRRRGVAVTAVLASPDRTHPGGLAALRRRFGRIITSAHPRLAEVIAGADVVVDGLLGLGGAPPLRSPMDRLVDLAAAGDAWRIAIDVPSGVDPETGRAPGPHFRADLTVSIGAMKTALLLGDGVGTVEVAEIGMSPQRWAPEAGHDAVVLEDRDIVDLVPALDISANKYSTGVVGVVAGSARYPGAAILAAGGAVRLRPGLVRYVGAQATEVVRHWPEVVAHGSIEEAGRVDAWVVGPGLGTDGQAADQLQAVLSADRPVLIDADALTLLSDRPQLLAACRVRRAATVLTPHGGEFARLFPDLDATDRAGAARAAAARTGAIVLLKGHRTVIADPGGRLAINLSGSPWLASAGSGDVLSGMAGSLLAAMPDAWLAATLAAFLHGRAGERAERARAAGAGALLDLIGV